MKHSPFMIDPRRFRRLPWFAQQFRHGSGPISLGLFGIFGIHKLRRRDASAPTHCSFCAP